MALPTTVTQRAELNEYVAQTGMAFAVQTGHAIRTGFYLTNSGNAAMTLNITTQNVYDAFDFISGVNENISINPGSTKFVPFDFYGYKPISGPYAPLISGPAGTGYYSTYCDLNFTSESDGKVDPNGAIRLYLTGYVTGYYGRSAEFEPSYPSGFLVLSNQYGLNGLPKNTLYWQHPKTGYYFDKYKIQYSEDHTSNWSDLTTLEFEKIESLTKIAGINFDTFMYSSPTGLVGNQLYAHEDLEFEKDYYYRIRGEHYGPLTRSTLISNSEWVYGYPVTDFNQNITNADVLAGLRTGTATLLDNTVNPNGIINCETPNQQALKIYFKNLESNINLKSKFDEEVQRRNINLNAFDSTDPAYAFTGVHFILPKNYIVGSTDENKAGIETGDKIVDSSNNEIKTILFLEKDSVVAGQGGKGGDGGYINITDIDVNAESRFMTINTLDGNPDTALSTVGSNGTDAIKITDSGIDNFEIHADTSAKIYGGGGGGGGGDATYLTPILEIINGEVGKDYKNLQSSGNDISLDVLTNLQANQIGGFGNGEFYVDFYSVSNIKIKKQDLLGYHNAGVGGGGMCFSSSSPGKFLLNNYFPTQNFGSFFSPGAGSLANLKNRISGGGAGGYFGQDGQTPTEYWLRTFRESGRIGETRSQKGGYAGYAINTLGNTNYTKSNIKSKLFFIRKYVEPSSIRGFLARWSAEDYVYNNYSTLALATNGQKVQRWLSSEYNSSITQPYIQGSNGNLNDSRSPSYILSDSKFNDNPSIMFYDYQYSLIKNIVDNTLSNNLLFNDSTLEFDIFYNLYPTSTTNPQFDESSKEHKNENYVLHYWSDSTYEKIIYINSFPQTYTYDTCGRIYGNDGRIYENLGVGDKMAIGEDFSFTSTNNSIIRDTSFVYNVSSKIVSNEFIDYKVYSNNLLAVNYNFNDLNFNFIDDPILGSPYTVSVTNSNDEVHTVNDSASQKTSFRISEIIIFNRKLNQTERHYVNSYLNSKYKTLKYVNNSELSGIITTKESQADRIYEQLKNNYFEKTNIAGYIATQN